MRMWRLDSTSSDGSEGSEGGAGDGVEADPEPQGQQHPGAVVGVSRRKLADSCFRAVAAARFRQVKFLLDNGVSPAIRNDLGQSLLVAALHIPDPDKRRRMLTYLLHRGVPCGGRDAQGRDVLSWTCILGYGKQLQQIAAAAMGNVDLHRQDAEGMTPLHHAVRQGHVHIVRFLIGMMTKFRLSVDVPDVHGLTPYLYARRMGNEELAEMLVNDGHASKKQFDSQQFHSADEWEVIGAQERRANERNDRERQLTLYKIRGRLPPVDRHKIIVPRLSIPGDDVTDHNRDDPCMTGRSLDTAMALLNLHPEARVISRRPSKAPRDLPSSTDPLPAVHRYRKRRTCQDNIPSIMDILAEQRCPSFRPKATITHLPPPAGDRRKGKGKVSTLAILLHGKKEAPLAGRRRSVSHQITDSRKMGHKGKA